MAQRLRGRVGYPSDDPFAVTLHPDRLEKPFRWRKPRRIFVCSMGDLFHDEVPDDFIAKVYAVAALNPWHTLMVLTKRPERALRWYEWAMGDYEPRPGELVDEQIEGLLDRHGWQQHADAVGAVGQSQSHYHGTTGVYLGTESWTETEPLTWPLPNVWLGVTAEDQQRADERIPVLLKIPAAVRFVSIEPMLEQVDAFIPCEHGTPDWLIVGGETGPGARPMVPDWARNVRDKCHDPFSRPIPFFFKKMGGGRETPDDLDIRQFPEVTHG